MSYSGLPGSAGTAGVPCTLPAGSPNFSPPAPLTPSTDILQNVVDVEWGAGRSIAYYPNSPPILPVPGPPTAPTVPTLVLALPTTLTVQFDTASVQGTPPITYSILYSQGLTPNISVPATQVGDTTVYQASVVSLTPTTGYYFEAVATNSVGVAKSARSPAFETVVASAPNTPPIPTLVGSPTSNSITVQFSVAGQTGTPPLTYGAMYGKSNTPATYQLGDVSGTVCTVTVTPLTPSTAYYFKAAATNQYGHAESLVSPPFTTAAGPSALLTNLVIPFLIQGPRFNKPYQSALDYYVNVDAVGATQPAGTAAPQGTQIIGSMYAHSALAGGETDYAGKCTADQPYSLDYGTVTDEYLVPLQKKSNVLVSWGGYYADILGLFGPYQPSGYPGTNPAVADVVKSICAAYFGVQGVPNPLLWFNTGWFMRFDGIVLDFENVGYGGIPGSNQYPLPQAVPPQFPADANAEPYKDYAAALASIPSLFHTTAPGYYLANAPVSLSINGDALGGVKNGNICAPNTALNTWFAFASSSVVPSSVTYNNVASLALNHPAQMSYFDDIFVQFYNENPDNYLGGANFVNILAQWGYVALQAQKLGVKITKINIGLARGNIIPGSPPGGGPYVASVQGPTPPLDSLTQPPFAYFYPQYATDSPPNSVTSAQNAQFWPNTSPQVDPTNLASAITAANTVLIAATGTPALTPKDWCSGMGFWAGTNATLYAQRVYTAGDPICPGSVLPAEVTYCWSDASYPAPDPVWKGNTPIVNRL